MNSRLKTNATILGFFLTAVGVYYQEKASYASQDYFVLLFLTLKNSTRLIPINTVARMGINPSI